MTLPISVATWNIHKGFSPFNRRLMVHELRERLRALNADIVFLQEVQGQHIKHAAQHAHWPAEPQHEFLAADMWHNSAYGQNMVYEHGHHGNAILSRFPILHEYNQDVTHLRFERRGLLHCVIELPHFDQALHCVCVHLSLFARSRRWQLDALASHIDRMVIPGAPLLIAGDFNDWRNHAGEILAHRLGLSEIFTGAHPLANQDASQNKTARPSRSYPAALPLFRLDRIYQRGLSVTTAHRHAGLPWYRISDHAALSATLQIIPIAP